MDNTFETWDSYAGNRHSGSSFTPKDSPPRLDKTFSPQRDNALPYGTSAPQRDSSSYYHSASDSFDWEDGISDYKGASYVDDSHLDSSSYYHPASDSFDWVDGISDYKGDSTADDVSDATFSDRTYSGTDGSLNDSSLSYSDRVKEEEDEELANYRYYMRAQSPYVDIDKSLEDDVFEEESMQQTPSPAQTQTFDRTFSPQRDNNLPYGTSTPQREDSPSYNNSKSDSSWSSDIFGWVDDISDYKGASPVDDISDATFSDKTYSGTDGSLNDSSLSYSDRVKEEEDEELASYRYFMRAQSPYVDIDAPLEDEVFEPGTFPLVLRPVNSEGFRHLSLDRGYYPADMAFDAHSQGITWQRPALSPQSEYLNQEEPLQQKPSPAQTQTLDTTFSPQRDNTSPYGTNTPRRDSPSNHHSESDSSWSSDIFGWVDDISGYKGASPVDDISDRTFSDRTYSGTDRSSTDSLGSYSDRQNVERKMLYNETPPMTETARRYDRKHGMFTPTSAIKKDHYVRRNLFDASPDYPPPKDTKRANKSIEWEWEWLNRQHNSGPSGAGLNAAASAENPTFNRKFDEINCSQPYGYQTPSYQEPEEQGQWTFPMRRNEIPPSPEQDLLTAVEDEGFDYYSTPSNRNPRYYNHPQTK